MTAFSEQERSMMWGIFGELETMNRTLANLVELLERQAQARPAPDRDDRLPDLPDLPRGVESG